MSWLPERQSTIPVYRQVINWMMEQIELGHWPADMKLPTQRKLAERFNVNRSTVIQALEELKADGILIAKVGSGIYVNRRGWEELMKGAVPHWKERINQSLYKSNIQTIQLINEYEKSVGIIRLGTGELSPALIPTEALQLTMRDVSITDRDFGYSEPKGHLVLRQALSSHLQKQGIQASSDQILIVSGGIQALQLISIGLIRGQSSIYHHSPSYLHSIPSISSTSIECLMDSSKGSKQTLFYSIPTLNNPTGKILTVDERQELLKRCTELQIPIIEDDVYRDLTFEEPPPAIKSFDRTGQVIYIGSMSKTLSPGLRIGWMVGPESVIDHLADLKMQLDYGSSAISQLVVADWLRSASYQQHITHLKAQLKDRARFTESLLRQYFSDIAEWESPQGGFYIWLRMKEPVVTKALFQRMLKREILINPGYIYAPNDYHHIRISYSYCSYDELEKGLKALSQEVKT